MLEKFVIICIFVLIYIDPLPTLIGVTLGYTIASVSINNIFKTIDNNVKFYYFEKDN